MSEFSTRRGGSEGYEARDDDKQEKAPALFLRRGIHFCPQCGQFPMSAAGAFVPAQKRG